MSFAHTGSGARFIAVWGIRTLFAAAPGWAWRTPT